jgi:lysophospholipase L1-like esterase
MPDIAPKVLSPTDLVNPEVAGSFDIYSFRKRMLAQGDSWFSIGHLPPWSTTSIPEQMTFSTYACIVNCARPGEELAHMTERLSQTPFLQLLNGNRAEKWDAILLSGGGNDLIDVALVAPTELPEHRLLLKRSEWTADAAPERYLSAAGWQSFENHFEAVFDAFIHERDKSINVGVPIIFHSYDWSVPRNAGAGLGFGPWLYKAFTLYSIPDADRVAVAEKLQSRLRDLLQRIASRPGQNLHLVDTLGTIARANPQDSGESGDWENEIHPNPHGYSQLAAKWRPVVELVW